MSWHVSNNLGWPITGSVSVSASRDTGNLTCTFSTQRKPVFADLNQEITLAVAGDYYGVVFSGRIESLEYNTQTGLCQVQCATAKNRTLRSKSAAEIEQLVGGGTHPLLDEQPPVEMDAYADLLIQSVQGDLVVNRHGNLVKTNWHTGAGTNLVLLDAGANVQLGPYASVINRMEITLEWRWQQWLQTYILSTWDSGLDWYTAAYGYPLPTEETILNAANSGGWKSSLSNIVKFPPTFTPTPSGGIFVNSRPEDCLSVRIGARRRWSRDVSETYHLVLSATSSIQNLGAQTRKISQGIELKTNESEAKKYEDFEVDEPPVLDHAKFATIFKLVCKRAAREIVESHLAIEAKGTCEFNPGLELGQRASLAGYSGSVTAYTHTLDISSGSASTQVTLGGLLMPSVTIPEPPTPLALASSPILDAPFLGGLGLQTYYGGLKSSLPLSGNERGWIADKKPPLPNTETYDQQRFVVELPEIPRDAITYEVNL